MNSFPEHWWSPRDLYLLKKIHERWCWPLDSKIINRYPYYPPLLFLYKIQEHPCSPRDLLVLNKFREWWCSTRDLWIENKIKTWLKHYLKDGKINVETKLWNYSRFINWKQNKYMLVFTSRIKNNKHTLKNLVFISRIKNQEQISWTLVFSSRFKNYDLIFKNAGVNI